MLRRFIFISPYMHIGRLSVVCAVAICDKTGSAAALAASCKNLWRGSFIGVLLPIVFIARP